jgi:DNA-binding NtrC family response regulator
MKRILVIDESEAVRETLALVLGCEFSVVKRPPSSSELYFAEANEDIDLMILGVTPGWGAQTATLLRFVAQAPFAVLFLVDTKTAARALAEGERAACLTKPFNPYELREKVGQLLGRREAWLETAQISSPAENQHLSHWLDYPLVSRSVATLARRFAASRLPILIFGELGCGQSQVARALSHAQGGSAPRFFIDARAATADSLDAATIELVAAGRQKAAGITLVIESLDKAEPPAQFLLAKFLQQREEKFATIGVLSTANADLLERVYRGEFLEDVYYRVAALTLKLSPLRDRREDIAALAERFARIYADRLGLGDCVVSQGAKTRLADYLWFGNLHEMEAVLARTLALHRKPVVEAADLVFDFGAEVPIITAPSGDFAEFVPAEPAPMTRGQKPAEGRQSAPAQASNGHGKLPELNVVIHELAHELKNPMVTIKTFAQLLGDRYDDDSFRARFQEVVGSDIERMDDLLEAMVEFADFAAPRGATVILGEKLRSVVEDVGGACAKRQTRVKWTGNGGTRAIRADDAQLTYILKNVLLAVLAQAKMGSEIEIELTGNGSVVVSYMREGARLASITHYLSETSGESHESLLPLRLLLAKQLVERNGGRLVMDQSDNERETVRMEFPIGQHGNSN